jgi:hypothetical protein
VNPTLWRVSRPNIAEELRKIPAEFRAALRKRSRAPSSVREGSMSGPTQLQAKVSKRAWLVCARGRGWMDGCMDGCMDGLGGGNGTIPNEDTTTTTSSSSSSSSSSCPQFEQALGISRSAVGPDGAAVAGGRDSESIRRESDLDDPNKIVPCYGEVWVQKRNRLREKTSFADAVGAFITYTTYTACYLCCVCCAGCMLCV